MVVVGEWKVDDGKEERMRRFRLYGRKRERKMRDKTKVEWKKP